MSVRDEFTPRIKTALAGRVGNHCSNPGCRQPTSGPKTDPSGFLNVGVAAHMTAASPGGPRYDESLTPDFRKSAKNGIWLCQTCAKLIDSDVERYTVDVLNSWKSAAEANALLSIESPASVPATQPHWLRRNGCPQFEMYPGVNPAQVKIGGDIHIFGAHPCPNSIEVKWEGGGTDTDWTIPTPTVVRKNGQLAYHMGWVGFQPGDSPEIEVRFTLRFWWDNEQHCATWIWYLMPHSTKQGIWEMNHRKGSGTHQPKLEDTW